MTSRVVMPEVDVPNPPRSRRPSTPLWRHAPPSRRAWSDPGARVRFVSWATHKRTRTYGPLAADLGTRGGRRASTLDAFVGSCPTFASSVCAGLGRRVGQVAPDDRDDDPARHLGVAAVAHVEVDPRD